MPKAPKIPIPSVAECLDLIDHYRMLDNIRRHSFKVARVAEALVSNLALPDDVEIKPPPMDLVLAGALLHDIAKTVCLDGSCRHADRGREICEHHGYPEVGSIVGEHVTLSNFNPPRYRRGRFSAREIVYYADKRVNHEEIVPLADRLDYIIGRYSAGSTQVAARIATNFQTCLELEHYLFIFLPFEPDELASVVRPEPF